MLGSMSDGAEQFHQPMVRRTFSLHRRSGQGRRIETGPTHENPGFELSWIGSGSLEFTLGDGARIAASAGASILLPPDLLNTPRSRATFIQQVLVARDLF
jgi:hypothetical protein